MSDVVKKYDEIQNRPKPASDPFKNFRSGAVVGVGVERFILVRVLDKISRISNILERPPAVQNESLEDSLLDAINYLALLLAFRRDPRNKI